MELGTRQYPFRSLNLVMVDIFNTHSNTEKNITVLIMENTMNYLTIEYAQVINITNVRFDTYSSYYPLSPNRATLVITDADIDFASGKTLFNIIQSMAKKTLDASNMEPVEYGEIIQTNSYGFLVNRASVSFNNFEVISELSNPSASVTFVHTVYGFFKTVSFTNMHFEIQGLVFQNNVATVNVYVNNTTLDLYKATGAFMYSSF